MSVTNADGLKRPDREQGLRRQAGRQALSFRLSGKEDAGTPAPGVARFSRHFYTHRVPGESGDAGLFDIAAEKSGVRPITDPVRSEVYGAPATATDEGAATLLFSERSCSRLLRKILLARFLERPLAATLAAAKAAEEVVQRNGLFDGRNAPLGRRRLYGAEIHPGAARGEAFGSVCVRPGRLVVLLHSAYSSHEYVVDGPHLVARLDRLSDGERVKVLRAVRTLLLVSTRNRITLEVCRIVCEAQPAFLRRLDEARMVPLTGRAVAEEARRRGVAAADATRVSRILRSTVVVLRDASTRPLRVLCPTSRAVLRAQVRRVLELERRLRARGRLQGAWSDAAIARRLARRAGVSVSRRLVSYCRKMLGAPGARARTHRGCYMTTTMGFSTLVPLERKTVFQRAPAAPGVYELRLARGERDYTPAGAGVIYLGRAKDLRRRLFTHASGNGRNHRLARHIARSRVLFRFLVEADDLKNAESRLYRQFCETYGRPPECNRVPP